MQEDTSSFVGPPEPISIGGKRYRTVEAKPVLDWKDYPVTCRETCRLCDSPHLITLFSL